MMCPKDECNGEIEAHAKVYFDVVAEQEGDWIMLSRLSFSPVNDTLHGHPVALESELVVSCNECGEEFPVRFSNGLRESIDWQAHETNRGKHD